MYQTRAQRTFKRFMRDRLAVLGGIIVLILVLAAIFADQLAPLDPLYQYPDGVGDAGQPIGGNARFPLGTDRYGRDVLSRLILGARVSLVVGIVANFLALMIGVVIGSIAGYAGGMVETFLMRFTDVMLSVPMLLLAMFLSAIWQPSLYVVIIVIAFCYWAPLARVIHGEVLHIKELTFIEATRALGGSSYRIVFGHIVPQLVSVILVYLTLGVATTVILEASLSYLGLGVPQPTPSWGSMVSDGQSYFMLAPWLVIYPGLAVMITVLGFNLLGDGLRDALMNRSQERSEPR